MRFFLLTQSLVPASLNLQPSQVWSRPLVGVREVGHNFSLHYTSQCADPLRGRLPGQMLRDWLYSYSEFQRLENEPTGRNAGILWLKVQQDAQLELKFRSEGIALYYSWKYSSKENTVQRHFHLHFCFPFDLFVPGQTACTCQPSSDILSLRV